MPTLQRILLVDDGPRDTEMALHALGGCNEAVPLHDGAEMPGFVFRCGSFAGRAGNQPVGIWLGLKMPRIEGLGAARQMKWAPALRQTGACRAVLNELPPGSERWQGKV